MNATPPVTDATLLARFRAGEERAFDTLFERYRLPLTRYATRLIGDGEEARDVCVDAYVRVLDGRLTPKDSLKGLLFTTTHRLCIDRLRRRTRWARVRRLWTAAPRRSTTPEQVAVDGEDHDRLTAAIAALPDGHRAAVALVYDEGLTTREASDILGLTPVQLRSKLAYARRLIREHVHSDAVEDP